MTRALVCGGRAFTDREFVHNTLWSYHGRRPIAVVIHGAARGADALAASWAHRAGVKAEPFPADWRAHPKAAGPIRNQRMLDEGKPDVVLAFPGGRGTADMCRRAIRAGVTVIYYQQKRETATA